LSGVPACVHFLLLPHLDAPAHNTYHLPCEHARRSYRPSTSIITSDRPGLSHRTCERSAWARDRAGEACTVSRVPAYVHDCSSKSRCWRLDGGSTLPQKFELQKRSTSLRDEIRGTACNSPCSSRDIRHRGLTMLLVSAQSSTVVRFHFQKPENRSVQSTGPGPRVDPS